jgi:hypothetical protein
MDEKFVSLLKAYRGEIPKGPEGERIMRRRAKTKILEEASLDDILKPKLSIEEMNDILEYLGWAMWDLIGMRATEGESGLIPRQEYESLGFIQEFYRFPQLYEAVTHKVGPEGLVRMGEIGRKEIGTKINMVHNICTGLCPLMGRGLLIKMGWIKPEDHVKEINTFIQFMRRVCWGYRGDGYIFTTQKDNTNIVLEDKWINRFLREVEPLDKENHRQTFSRLNSSTELLSFLVHYDSRAGMGDSGPYDLGNGKLMIVRDHFLREDIYHWCDVCQDLPYAVTLAFILDTKKMGLEELKVVIGASTFTKPSNYHPFITDASFYIRKEWDTPTENIERLSMAEAKELARLVQEVTFKLYKKTAKMSRRQLITNGVYVYYIDMILPYARAAGLYDTFCRDFDLWEFAQEASEAYYVLLEDNYAQKTLPQILITGDAFPSIPYQYYW